MAVCEKCWEDAYLRAIATGKPQSECYYELLEERKDNPCIIEDKKDKLLGEILYEDSCNRKG